MKYNVISYFLSEGVRNVFKNKKSAFACLFVMWATMFIFGLFYAIGKNVNNIVKDLQAKMPFNVFIQNEATEDQIQELGEQISKINGVNKITYVSKEEAYNIMREKYKNFPYVMEGRDPYIFPASYSVTLTDLSLNEQVQQEIQKLENVDSITNKNETIKTLLFFAKAIKMGTMGILIVIIAISVFIIANTIKLTVHARRKEISIMKYVGATNSFIRTPFIIEGIIIGLMAGVISILTVGGCYKLITNTLVQWLAKAQIGINILLPFSDISTQVIIVYLVLGLGIGIVGSSISMRKYLEV